MIFFWSDIVYLFSSCYTLDYYWIYPSPYSLFLNSVTHSLFYDTLVLIVVRVSNNIPVFCPQSFASDWLIWLLSWWYIQNNMNWVNHICFTSIPLGYKFLLIGHSHHSLRSHTRSHFSSHLQWLFIIFRLNSVLHIIQKTLMQVKRGNDISIEVHNHTLPLAP